MPASLRIALAIIAGIIFGSVVNMTIVLLGPMILPPPPGVDVTSAEGLKASMHLLEPRHFVFPFLAHALGTLTGALVGAALVTQQRSVVAYGIGAFFLAGGITASVMIPAPGWFVTLDVVLAYIPMAWIGLTLANRLKPVAAA